METEIFWITAWEKGIEFYLKTLVSTFSSLPYHLYISVGDDENDTRIPLDKLFITLQKENTSSGTTKITSDQSNEVTENIEDPIEEVSFTKTRGSGCHLPFLGRNDTEEHIFFEEDQ
eukprot:TRINITY_DN590_c5_g1_i3.p1 TRINITY_DN590_c5_g1~~TRINITY_DN590_c5_g1_i3.p1  ORF type:complete len:117 (-),score=18.26 TRINITY_DN590_c5_g1_i3:217-567(-)